MVALATPVAAQLIGLGSQTIHQCSADVAGECQTGDQFGHALAACDIDGDGFDDLVVGVPGQTVSGSARSGALHVFYGSPGGLKDEDDRVLTQSSLGISEGADDELGAALACGDFDDDGFFDVAAGVPGDDDSPRSSVGIAVVVHGNAGGVDPADRRVFRQLQGGLPCCTSESAETNDLFGFALAAIPSSGGDWLAIGVPGEDLAPGQASAGKVHLIRPDRDGVALNHNFELTQDTNDSGFGSTHCDGDRNEAFDAFGYALAGGFALDEYLLIGAPLEDFGDLADVGRIYAYADFNPLHFTFSPGHPQNVACYAPGDTDLANGREAGDLFGSALAARVDRVVVGVPGEDRPSAAEAGVIHIFSRGGDLLSLADDDFVSQDAVPGDATEPGDEFGFAVAVGDFDRNGLEDVAAGAPGESISLVAGAGAVNVLYDAASPASEDQTFHQDSPQVLDAPQQNDHFGAALAAGDFDGNGVDDLAIGVPDENLVSGQTNEGLVTVLYGRNRQTGAFGTVRFKAAAVSVVEGDSTVARTLPVERQGGARLSANVAVGASSGTATAGVDFGFADQTASWP